MLVDSVHSSNYPQTVSAPQAFRLFENRAVASVALREPLYSHVTLFTPQNIQLNWGIIVCGGDWWVVGGSVSTENAAESREAGFTV